MATIGYLRLLFGADTAPLKKGCKEAKSSIHDVADAGSRMGSVLGTAGGAAAIGVGVAAVAMGALVKSSADAMDATHDMAERLGTSTEALSRLGYAAKLSGVDASTLEGSLDKMNVRLGEIAQTGKGPAADALNKLGISAADLAEKDPSEAFHTLVGAIGSIENPAKRAATAVDIFGKSGTGLVGLAAQGKDGLAALEAEADKLGATVSGLDAAKIGEMNDGFDRISTAVGGVGNAIAGKVAPYIAVALEKTLDLGLAAQEMGSHFGEALDYVSNAAATAGELLDSVGVNSANAWWLADEAVEAVGSGIDFVVDAAILVQSGITELGAVFLQMGADGVKTFGWLTSGVSSFVDSSLGYLQSFVGYLEDWLDFLTRPITDLLKALGVLPKAFSMNIVSPVIQAGRDVATADVFAGLTKNFADQLEAAGKVMDESAMDQFSKIGSGKGDGAKMLKSAGSAIASAVESSGIADILTSTIPNFIGGIAGDFMKSVDAVEARAADSLKQSELFRGVGGEGGAAGVAETGEKKYAGAFDIDSKEARSAILTAKGLSGGDDKNGAKTAQSTAIMAAESKAQTSILKDIKSGMGNRVAIGRLEFT